MSKLGEGVHDIYKERATTGGDILWHATIKGQKELSPGIPLHMSLKVFSDKKEMHLDELKAKVKEHDIKDPDPSKLSFKTTIFTSERDGKKYYMLLIDGVDKNYSDFYESLKHCGTVYKKFMPHVTIDKGLYDKINEEGIKSEEISFEPLSIEFGAGNTVHQFKKSELIPLEKSVFRNIGVATALGAALSGNPAISTQSEKAPKAPATQIAMATPAAPTAPKKIAQPSNPYSASRMLHAIADVESSGGKNKNHAAGGGPIHGTEHAYGKYGLMPQTIRETIKMDRNLRTKYKKATILHGTDLHHYMQDNPKLEDAVAEKYLNRLEHHFGKNPSDIGYAWLQGIRGTYKAKKNKEDISNHWHVQKIRDAYSKEK